MIHDLSRRVFGHVWGRRVLLAISLVFLGVQGWMAIRPSLPKPWHANYPWGMFKDASRDNKEVVAWGYLADGTRVDIDLTRWFRYTRGATNLRIYDHHVSMRKHESWNRKDQRAFARWLAHRVYVEDGLEIVEVRLRRIRRRIGTKRERIEKIRVVRITEADRNNPVPKEALIDRR